ncbi:MAG: GTPase HflX [Spirochaetaceae bacterium]|nr:GTPase HflX [Spirochaetaceae bacterium]
MPELKETALRPERAFLVGVQTDKATRTDKVSKTDAESLLKELGGLAESLGVEVAGSMLVRVRERNAALFLGTGKAEEVVAAAKAEGADSILFDHPLTPVQQRNWEALADLKVYDRSELIIKIFASRALTREAGLQVELAQLEFSLPRLAHSYEALSRQRGGRYGTKGSGEQKIELDRREIEKRIHEIKEELKDVRKSREVQRKRRERQTLPRAAVVGYTNAGKSSLLNALTRATVHVEDKLFATLDPTTRRIALSKGGALLLTDTVGFVRNLPHGLVEAFKATLEEAAAADLLVHVADASDPEVELHMATTEKVLREIGAGEVPSVLVLNKIDLIEDPSLVEGWRARHPASCLVSVKTGEGLPALLAAIEEGLTARAGEFDLRIPDTDYALVALLHREASILEESREDDATILRCRLPERLESRFEAFRRDAAEAAAPEVGAGE